MIDGQITVEILQIKGNTVRLGISAPRDVKIMRGELKPFGMTVIEAQMAPPIAVAS
jgi:carbon storage regulator CsrA